MKKTRVKGHVFRNTALLFYIKKNLLSIAKKRRAMAMANVHDHQQSEEPSEDLKKLVHWTIGPPAQGPCNICVEIHRPNTRQQKCLFTVTILVNINDTPDPHLYIEKLGVGKTKLPLSDGLNCINWCERYSNGIKIVCDARQRHIPLSEGWTVIYENNDLFYSWPYCLSALRRKLENRNWSYPNLMHPYHTDTHLKANAARTIIILCKIKTPPALASLARLAVMINYTKGKEEHRFLPCPFKVNVKKIPKNLQLNDMMFIRLSHSYHEPSLEPLEDIVPLEN
jgi:hypothetical protein